MARLKHLFSPIRIGSMEVENRVVMPGMTVGFGVDEEGCPTDQLVAFYAERAKGRPGMIVVSSTLVHPAGLGRLGPRRIALWDEKALPGLQRLVNAIHQYDVKAGLQLIQNGAQEGFNMVGPSDVPPIGFGKYVTSREMTKEEIKEIVQGFGQAARLCIGAGFDYLEINGAFDYILSQFLIPYYNRRVDEYGGSLENRARFLLEVVRQVMKEVGSTAPIGVKLNGDDFLPEGGWTLPDACMLAPILETEGVSCLHIAGGVVGGRRWFVPSMYEEQGAYLYLSEEIKKHTSLPIIAAVRIKNPEMADDVIGRGRTDLVAMGRAHIADPQVIDKARNGEVAEIRPCIAECKGCIGAFDRDPAAEASCAVNPRVGREQFITEVQDDKVSGSRRVLVAGAGCAGLEAARRAAFAGHKVVLCDSKGRIGGQLRLAAMMPKRQEIADILPWYERQLNRLNVQIRLNTPVDEHLLEQINPDVLIVATGSLPDVPLGFLVGLENIKDIQLLMVDDLLEGQELVGDKILVVGGDQIGLQLADYLSEDSVSVYVVEQDRRLAAKMAMADRLYLMQRIAGKGLQVYRGVQQVNILPFDEVRIVDREGKEIPIDIDTIVLASQRHPDAYLAGTAEGKGIEAHIVGDARRVVGEDQGTILAAIADGYDVGRQI